MASSVRAVTLTGPRAFAPVKYPLPELRGRDMLLEVTATGICGTDLKLWRGDMHAPPDLIMGHEILGRVVATGPDADGAASGLMGQRVVLNAMLPCWNCLSCHTGEYRFCSNRRIYGVTESSQTTPHLWGGFAEMVYVAPGSLTHPIPDHVSDRAATVLGMLANGVEWSIFEGGAGPGTSVVVQGPGIQGVCSALAAREAGAETVVVTGTADDADRLDVAAALTGAIPITSDGSIADRVKEVLGADGADIVVDTTGSVAALEAGIDMLKRRGRLVVVGLTGTDARAKLPLDTIVWKALTVRGVLGKTARAFDVATKILANRWKELEGLVTHEYGLDEVARAFEEYDDGTARPTKAIIRP